MTGYRAKKRLGQHFLISDEVVCRIVDTIQPQPGETLVEIGPGQGVLTGALASRDARIVAVEFDRDLIPSLEKRFASTGKVTLINRDFLSWQPTLDRFALVGNLPYNLTTPVIEWCVTYRSYIARAVFMVQKELAERLAASPDTKAWSPISIFTQLCFDVKSVFDVPSTAFEPPPQVVSTVISLRPAQSPAVDDMPRLQKVVRASFVQRRKLLTGNLTKAFHIPMSTVREVLAQVGLPVSVRAEQVTIEQFLALTRDLAARRIV